jgi:uncharacterized protein (DUF362 family)
MHTHTHTNAHTHTRTLLHIHALTRTHLVVLDALVCMVPARAEFEGQMPPMGLLLNSLYVLYVCVVCVCVCVGVCE